VKNSSVFPRIGVGTTILVILCWMVTSILFAQPQDPHELRAWKVPGLDDGAEFYFSPDGTRLIGNAKVGKDTVHHVYTIGIGGEGLLCINRAGEDACSFYFPNGKRLLFTSTRDHLDMPRGNYSNPFEYPQGAELYSCNVDGSDVKRLTNNTYYDAEASISPDGKWVLFTRQIDGKLDLWKMFPDGSRQTRITKTEDWQEGGAFFIDNETIICRAWEMKNQAQRGMPMSIFTVKQDGSGRTRITTDEGTNWAPHPAPDGEHFVFVKVLPPHNYEVFLMSLKTGEQKRLTYNDAFDGFPVISPDGALLTFSSNRDARSGERSLRPYLMDVSSLTLGRKK
jgi:TolB protein